MPKTAAPAKPTKDVDLLLDAVRAIDAARDVLLDMTEEHADQLETVYDALAVAAGRLLISEATRPAA